MTPPPAAPPEASELARLFATAFPRFNARKGVFDLQPPSVEDMRLANRMTEISEETTTNPGRIEGLDHPSLRRYWYLTGVSFGSLGQGLLWRLSQGESSPQEACRTLDRIEIDSLEGYSGKGDPIFFTDDAPALVEGVYAMLEERGVSNWQVAQACQESAYRVARPGSAGPRARGQDNLFPFLTEIEKSRLYYAHPETLEKRKTELAKLILTRGEETAADRQARKRAAIEYSYITFVEMSRRIATPQQMRVEACLKATPGATRKTCEYFADFQKAVATPHPFDNARLRASLVPRLTEFSSEYARLSPAQRAAPETLLLDGTLAHIAVSPEFGGPSDDERMKELDRFFQEITAETSLSLPPGQVLGLSEIISRKDAIQVAVEKLPNEVRVLASQIRLEDGTAWDYINQHLRAVIFAPRLSQMEAVGEPDGTALRLMRTAVVSLNGSVPKGAELVGLVGWLVHEASHVKFFWEVLPSEPKFAGATLLDERLAYLRETGLYEKSMKLDSLSHARPALKLFHEARRLLVYAANVGLGIEDKALEAGAAHFLHGRDPRLGLYPTWFLDRVPAALSATTP